MDIVVTVPKPLWKIWLMEGDLVGDPPTGRQYAFTVHGRPEISPGERVYVVAHGRLRGYAPLVELRPARGSRYWLIREGGAVAITINRVFRGFQGFRYRDWDRAEERPFPDWRTP